MCGPWVPRSHLFVVFFVAPACATSCIGRSDPRHDLFSCWPVLGRIVPGTSRAMLLGWWSVIAFWVQFAGHFCCVVSDRLGGPWGCYFLVCSARRRSAPFIQFGVACVGMR